MAAAARLQEAVLGAPMPAGELRRRIVPTPKRTIESVDRSLTQARINEGTTSVGPGCTGIDVPVTAPSGDDADPAADHPLRRRGLRPTGSAYRHRPMRGDGGTSTSTGDRLALGILGEWRTIGPADALTFGRRADLHVDVNRFMHRVVGRVVHRQGAWWLQNHGTTGRLTLSGRSDHSSIVVAPGEQVPIAPTEFAIRFTAGPTDYELDGHRSGRPLRLDRTGVAEGTATVEFGAVPLSAEQHLLIVALHDSAVRNDGSIEGSATIAHRLGWTTKKFHRKLDAICTKLDRQGVRGLKGDSGDLATSRRTVLLEHALDTGLVGSGDLGLLP